MKIVQAQEGVSEDTWATRQGPVAEYRKLTNRVAFAPTVRTVAASETPTFSRFTNSEHLATLSNFTWVPQTKEARGVQTGAKEEKAAD